jgi:uncharacterized Zn finger protein (UPF0148 family)
MNCCGVEKRCPFCGSVLLVESGQLFCELCDWVDIRNMTEVRKVGEVFNPPKWTPPGNWKREK